MSRSTATTYVEWLESEWKHGGADVALEPGGGDLNEETAKPASFKYVFCVTVPRHSKYFTTRLLSSFASEFA